MVKELFRNFAAGVVTSMRPDELPPEASPRAYNSTLSNVGGQHGVPAKRRGAKIQNIAAFAPLFPWPLVGMTAYKKRSGANFTQYLLAVDSNGSLYKLVSGAMEVADSGNTQPFTSGLVPIFAQANNLLFMVNGVDLLKFNGSTVSYFGFSRPPAPGATENAGAGNPNGTYEIAMSWGNSSTGHESSRSDATTVTVTNSPIDVTWAPRADVQCDQVFLHVRKTGVTSEFFRVSIGTTPAADGHGAYDATVFGLQLNITDAQLNALLIKSPDTAENNPPPAGIKSICTHHTRMFAIDNTRLYYSKLERPEAFDPDNSEPVNFDDGQTPIAIAEAFGELMVWKNRSLYALIGPDPQTWQLRLIDPTIGCVSQQSVKFADGYLYWWSLKGPVRWNGSGDIEPIGQLYIAPDIDPTVIDYTLGSQIMAEVDSIRQKIIWTVPELGSTHNNILIPFNYRTGSFDSNRWDPFEVASMCVAEDSAGAQWIYMGNYAGRIFQWWGADTDGAETVAADGTSYTLSGTATSVSVSGITDTTANFYTSGDKLKDLFLYTIDVDGVQERRKIASNNGTSIGVTPNFDTVPVTYAIASPNFQFDTKWSDFGDPFLTKHLLFLWAQAVSPTGAAVLTVDVFTNYNMTAPVRTFTFTATGSGGIWDESSWDEVVFGGDVDAVSARRRVAKRATSYRLRLRNIEPNSQVILTKLAMSAQPQGAKS